MSLKASGIMLHTNNFTMKQGTEGLRKLTETETQIERVRKMPKVSEAEMSKLTAEEREEISKEFTDKINSLKGTQRDEFISKLDEILPDDVKNQLWENNHYQITVAMGKFIEEYGKMPTKNRIAADTGLSRQTVHKHLSTYAGHPLYVEQITQFKFMADRVLAKVIKLAVLGDVKAARLYFDVMGNLNGQASNNTLIKNQTNYVQINGMVLSQETVKQLNPVQLCEIESILKAALPQTLPDEIIVP